MMPEMPEFSEHEKRLLKKAMTFCAYRERAASRVKQKLESWGADDAQTTKIIDYLVEEKFIDEVRFCRACCLDKFRLNKWGRLKIKDYMTQLGISEEMIEEGLQNIPPREYTALIRGMAEKKAFSLADEGDELTVKHKIIRFLTRKGFEYEEISKVL